ncbi:MAG: A/G-specific adenine glycosylase [Pirellulaceae bacterium]|nr:A/G-specific adenine glycosylase [Pirellulaceae bacterium]
MQDSSDRTRFRQRLLAWFDKHQRDLPWRKNRTRYRIWVSEIMLQQTQVVTVIDYFQRFIKRFPTVKSLAAAEESEVLKFWEGLGYYRRARQMHAAAIQIVKQHNGRFPDNFDEVLALPGIGRYSAGAILSIADDQPLPILEGNTVRVYARLMNFQEDVTKSASQKSLWAFADTLVTRKRPGDLNQALMELGSEICNKNTPQCMKCPVASFCLSLQRGDPRQLPNKGTKRVRYEALHQIVIVIQRRKRYAIRLCGPDEHWTGLWDFPRFTANTGDIADKLKQVTQETKQRTGLSVQLGAPFLNLKHAVTRYRIELDCYHAVSVEGRLRAQQDLRWASLDELHELAMSVTGRKIVRHLMKA